VEILVILLVLVALGVAGFLWFQHARSTPLGQRTETYIRSERQTPAGAPPREVTVDTLRPGDAISFWDGEDALVDTVLECEEQVGPRRTRWRWNLLRGAKMLETAPDGNVLYTHSEVFLQGSAGFATLTGEPAVGGVLKTFEARVRAGTVGSNPVQYEYQGKQYEVKSTGTFGATVVGAAPRADVWRDLADDPSQNVYFEMDGPEGGQALGIWTTHILLLVGEPLRETDVRNIFPGQVEPSA
jgi:hypothetical protein